MTDRFIIEHGVVHDIKTGRHLTQAIEDDYPQQLCDLLNEQERTIDGYREALLVLVELKRFKRQIEAGTANADMKRYYEANKEGAWLAAEAMLVGCVRTEERRIKIEALPFIRLLRDQRDEVAAVLRELVRLKTLKDGFGEEPFGSHNARPMRAEYERRKPQAWEAAKTILAKCPSHEQQLRNVCAGLGMTMEELQSALDRLPSPRGT